jgi:formate hydrogenlyase transcriptional activator
VDVRVIAATNRDLQEAVRTGRFRPDLFYRLNVFPIDVPPLRERRADIPQLVMFFLSRFSRKLGKQISAVSPETMQYLSAYEWPGNVRELQNVIERAVVLCEEPVLEIDPDLLPLKAATSRASEPVVPSGTAKAPPANELAEVRAAVPDDIAPLEEIERRHIVAALESTAGVIHGPKGAARILKLNPTTLRSRMAKLGITLKRTPHET